MLREDYEKLLKVFRETERYALQTKDSDLYYMAPYANPRRNYNYHGIYVDIFVLQRNNRFIAQTFERLMWKVLIYGSKIDDSSFARNPFYLYKKTFFGSIAVVRFLFERIPTNRLRHTYGGGFSRNVRHMEDLFPLICCEFKDGKFPIPGKYDSYLRRIYGDYMKLPEPDKVQPHIMKMKFLK